jgi:hypothetical protein
MTLPTFHFEATGSSQPEQRGSGRGRLRIVGEIFDASLGPLEDGTLRLPAWLRYRCETAETTAQTSAATVRTGFAAHAPRAVSRDGVTWGLAVEPATTNLAGNQDLTAWTNANTPIIHSAVTPSGSTEACEVEDDDAALPEYKRLTVGANPAFSTLPGGAYTTSLWMQNLGAGEQAIWQVLRDLSTVPLAIAVTGADATWTRRTFGAAVAGPWNAEARARPRNVNADVGRCRYWGMQLEARAYPTSFIGADNATFTRAAGSLMAPCEALAPAGYLTPTLRYRPQYTQTQTAGDHTLLYIDANTRVIFRKSDAKIVLTLAGVEIASEALTFSRFQELTVTIDHSDDRVRLIVSGATTGNGITVAAGAPALVDMPSWGYVLGGPNGAEEGAELAYLAPCRSFCDLVEERMLLQMSREAPHTKFRDLLCALARPFARIFDTALTVHHAFDLDDPATEGDALDKIGSIVGLRREGFPDERYRDFLRIQVELLLAVARDEAEWTGTGENILRIARTFIGPTPGDAIVLLNAPPYSYLLSVPGLDLDEAFLLRRFLRVATYAGVLGIMAIVLADDSLWESDAVSVTGGGIWCSASVSVTGCATWGTAVTTE